MNRGWVYRDRVESADAGLTVLEFYTRRYRHSTQEEWCDRIATGQVLLNDRATSASARLEKGDDLSYHRPPWQEPEVPLAIDLLYEDAELLVVAKPSGLPVLPGGGFLEHTLLWQLQQRYPNETPVPIHRLGRGTSGLLLLARSHLARSHLSQQMRDGSMQKIYRALIGSSDLPDRFTVKTAIGKIPHTELGYVYGAVSSGMVAHSECEVVQRTANTTLLNVRILTGRPHQIRIHLASVGYPLLGDPLYQAGGIPREQDAFNGSKLPVPGDCGYFLHAHQLTFIHPRSRQPFSVTCAPPPQLAGGNCAAMI